MSSGGAHHELGPLQQGCDTDYRITIETKQRVKVVTGGGTLAGPPVGEMPHRLYNNYRNRTESEGRQQVEAHTSWAPGWRDATQIIE